MDPLAHPDHAAAALAGRQRGIVSRRQLLALGFTAEMIKHRRATGRLHTLHRGVYAVGHRAVSPEARWLAAVFACGEGAVLSHRSAARVWGLRPWSGAIELTSAGARGARGTHALVVHKSELPRAERTQVDGIPVTTVPRTLLDLANVVPPHHLRRAVQRADEHELFDLRAVEAVLAAHPRRPGGPALRALLADLRQHGVSMTRSDVEAAVLQLCLDHGLPRPQVNRKTDDGEIDFRWPDHGLRVEVDGWATHRSRTAFVADRVRDRKALLAGERVARFAATEVLHHPERVAAELEAMLVRKRVQSTSLRTRT